MSTLLRRLAICAMAAAALGVTPVEAHHAFSANFDTDAIVEVRGRITTLQWQNPHVLLTLVADDGTTWAVESQAKNILERTQILPQHFAVGTSVALAGYPARAGQGVFALNALLEDGRELILRAGRDPYFDGRAGSQPENVLADGVAPDAAAQAAGIFRVWSMQFAGEGRWRWPTDYALTPAAAAARARFDPARDSPVSGCYQKGMPWIMEQPYPLEIARDGTDIVLRIEEGDVTRRIHMSDAPPAGVAPTRYGYSYGHWDGADLVVRTIAIDTQYLNATGIPLTPAVTTEERFALAAGGSRLEYTLTVADPGTLTSPLTVESYRVWRPGTTVQPYGCTAEVPAP